MSRRGGTVEGWIPVTKITGICLDVASNQQVEPSFPGVPLFLLVHGDFSQAAKDAVLGQTAEGCTACSLVMFVRC